MTAEAKWLSILESQWPLFDTEPIDRVVMANFIAILEEENGFERGAYIKKEKYGDINQIAVIFPSGAQVTLCQDADPSTPISLEYLNIWDIEETKVNFFPMDISIRHFLTQYWDKLFPKETT